MRILTAMLATETNMFAHTMTGFQDFADIGIMRAKDGFPRNALTEVLLHWEDLGRAEGHQVVHSLATFAAPAGKTVRQVYEKFRDEILAVARDEGPFDAVLLNLHGAMIADGYDDCEGDLLARLRDALGLDVTIGVELDLHCHLTDQMISLADVIITYKEYPHTDVVARAAEVYRLTVDAALRIIRPVMRTRDLPILNLWSTHDEPMRSIVDEMWAMESRPGILSLSFAHGFPWGDVPPGARTLAVTDGDEELAQKLADDLAQRLWDARETTLFKGLTIDKALDQAADAPPGLVVIADTADNTGGGAPGDSTFILRRVLERGIRDVAIGPLWDPMAVRVCMEAGLGSTLDLRIGGKTGPAAGNPVDAKVTVRGLADALLQESPYAEGQHIGLGPSAWIEIDGVHVILASLRMQAYGPGMFANIGLNPGSLRIAVVKSTNHFRFHFSRLTDQILSVIGPGCVSGEFSTFEYSNRSNTFWPRAADLRFEAHRGTSGF